MLKQPIQFVDFNGEKRDLDLYFNLTEAELIDWSADSERGIQADMQDAIITKDMRKLLDFTKDLIFRSYGERDKDGIHFDKSPEISRRFQNSAMYSPLLLALFKDEGLTLTNFINGLMPADLVERAMKNGGIPNPEEVANINAQYKPSARDIASVQQEIETRNVFNEAPAIGASDAAPDSPPIQVDRLEPELQEDPAQETRRAFRVKETPLDDDIAEERRAAEEDRAAFEAWRAAGRPPHESQQ